MRTRRGLSTVVGMVFSIIALTTTLVYITYSMNTLDQYNQAVLSVNHQSQNQNNEKFQVTSATFVNNKFNITLVNTGSLPISFTKLWIVNTTALSSDKVYYYSLTNSFVTPGGILKNIGQSVSCPPSPTCSFMTTPSYHIKLVTSRGNTQEFNINSISSTILNLQLLTMPPTVPSQFTTQLVMIVANNSTGVLANVIPQTPQIVTSGPSASTATCTLGALSPTSYPTLQVGQVALFTWPLTISGNPGQICTYTAQLQGSSQTVQATVTSTVVSLVPATTYSQYSGIMTINYTSFRWTQGNTWNPNWSFPSLTTTDFKLNFTNNNNTAGGYNLWVSKYSQLMLFPTIVPPDNKVVPKPFFIVGSIVLNPTLGITPYIDNSTGVPNQGGTTTLYFGASTAGGASQEPSGTLTANTPYYGMLEIYGKFTKNSLDASGGSYAQSVPYVAVISK